jgi:exosortase/archaeosortase family protein
LCVPRPGDKLGAMLRRIALFILIFAALEFGWQAFRDSPAAHSLVEHAIVEPAAFVINGLSSANVRAVGTHLRSEGGSLNIANGCDGLELLFLSTAGFAVAPVPWRSRIYGILLALPIIYALNQARILGLFFSLRNGGRWFDAFHGLLAPVIMVVIIVAYFQTWISRSRLDAVESDR